MLLDGSPIARNRQGMDLFTLCKDLFTQAIDPFALSVLHMLTNSIICELIESDTAILAMNILCMH